MSDRVVILSAFLRPFRSGAEACVEEVAARLQGDFEITIITARLRRSLPPTDTLDGVAVVRVGLGCGFDKWLFPLLAPLAVARLKPGLIHAVLESYAGLALVVCSWCFRKTPRLLTCQSTNTTLLVGAMHVAAYRIAVISTVLQERAKRFGRPDAVLIPNGIDRVAIATALAAHPKVPGRLLFAGRLEPMKGVDTLLHAFAAAREHMPEWHLRIAGDGSQRTSLESLAGELGLAGAVTFTGRQTHAEILREFAEAEIFAGLSRSEALGNVFLEAQASGCAVLGTRTGGIPDILLADCSGVLVAVDDVPAASAALVRLANDPGLRKTLGDAGRQNAAAYDWDDIARRYAALWREMLAR